MYAAVYDYGKDVIPCINNMSFPCKTISFAAKHGATTIQVEGSLSDGIDYVSLEPMANPYHQTYSAIIHSSILKRYNLFFQSTDKKRSASILVENATISDSIITLWNVAITFSNTNLNNVLIEDVAHNDTGKHVQVILQQSVFACEKNTKCGVILNHMSIVKFVMNNSELLHCELDLIIYDLYLDVSDSTIVATNINVNVISRWNVPTWVKLKRAKFLQPSLLGTQHKMTYHLTSSYVYMSIEACQFESVPVEIELERHFYGRSKGYMSATHVLFNGTTFLKAAKPGNGAAVFISSHETDSKVTFHDCSFINNRVVRNENGFFGAGGALFIDGAAITVNVMYSLFKDDTVTTIGSAIYATKAVLITIQNCTFDYDIKDNQQSLGSILVVEGITQKMNSHFLIANSKPETNQFTFRVLDIDKVYHLELDVKCPTWYRHSSDYTKLSKDASKTNMTESLDKFVYECLPCLDGHYLVLEREYLNTVITGGVISLPEPGECVDCPYGAICYGNRIVPRPNYWGYKLDNGKLNFTQCPPGYCCTANDDAPCTTYDSCAPNRTGMLCGSCKEGLFVSILTGECISESECEYDFLFWMFAIPISLAYALWYTFKGDILSYFLMLVLPVLSWINSCFQRKKAKDTTISQGNDHNPTPYTRKEKKFKKDNMNLKGLHLGKQTNTPSKKSEIDIEEAGAKTVFMRHKHKRRGYFGIVTFYVQMSAAMEITIQFSDIDGSKSPLDYVSDNIDRVLNFALSDISIQFCPISELSTHGKHISILAFLCSVYVCWGLIYTTVSFVWLCFRNKQESKQYRSLDILRLKFISGLVEIIKYTYEGFCEVIFMSLVCVDIRGVHVWWYDASQVCLETWQVGMLIFGVVFAIPFPLALFMAMKSLEQRKISGLAFFLCCFCPLLGIIFMGICNYCCKPSDSGISKTSETILDRLQGPFRKDPKHMTLYWETIVSVRRLLITGMALLRGYASIKMTVLSCLCILFLMHHIYRLPFQFKASNHVESLSLSLLLVFSIFNLLKASLTDSGAIPQGPTVKFFKALEFIEKLFPIILIIVIIIIEVRRKFKTKSKNQ